MGHYPIMNIITNQFNIRVFQVGFAKLYSLYESTLFTNNTYKYGYLNGISCNKSTYMNKWFEWQFIHVF